MHKVLFGPPGTGKTRSVIGLLQEHLAEDARHKALFCSHTKAAAQTAVGRWGNISTASRRLDISTIHSHCFKSLGLAMSQTVDDAKLNYFVSQFGMDTSEGSEANAYLECIHLGSNLSIPVGEAYQRSARPGTMGHFLAFARSYEAWKQQFGYVDFTDMLIRYPLLVRNGYGFTMLAVDEAQDLTPAHWRVIEHFMRLQPNCKVLVAGDDDQCIYGYTGAVALGAQQFADKTQAEVTILGQSHRVPKRVHAAAMRVVGRIESRVDKPYEPRDAEGVVQNWGDFQWGHSAGRTDRDTLILYSDRYIRKELVEPALMDRGIPYTALAGFPAPLDTRPGKALAIAHRVCSPSGEELGTIRRGLSDYGREAFDAIGPEAVLDKLRHNDFKVLANMHWSHEDYFRKLDWRLPLSVRISTIHGAKGMEAQDVHLVTARSPAQLSQTISNPDAQHRLFYVGVTRASERLFLYGGDNAYEVE